MPDALSVGDMRIFWVTASTFRTKSMSSVKNCDFEISDATRSLEKKVKRPKLRKGCDFETSLKVFCSKGSLCKMEKLLCVEMSLCKSFCV